MPSPQYELLSWVLEMTQAGLSDLQISERLNSAEALTRLGYWPKQSDMVKAVIQARGGYRE